MRRKPVKLIENLVNEFWDMREKFKKETIERDNEWLLIFDYPDYYGLSYKVYSKLSGDFVDSLQGDFFYVLRHGGIKQYNKFFKSKRDLNKIINKIWTIYGYCE